MSEQDPETISNQENSCNAQTQNQNEAQSSHFDYLDNSDPENLDEQYSEVSQEVEEDFEEQEVVFPEDYSEVGLGRDEEPVEEEMADERPNLINANTIPSPQSNYLENILQDQQEFLRSLNQADNQLMLDENFILLVSDMCNKNTQKMFKFDHRDEKVKGIFSLK